MKKTLIRTSLRIDRRTLRLVRRLALMLEISSNTVLKDAVELYARGLAGKEK